MDLYLYKQTTCKQSNVRFNDAFFVKKNHEKRKLSVTGHCSDAALSHDGGCQTVWDRLLPKT